MNIGNYDIESLRELVRDLQKENEELRLLLSEKGTQVPPFSFDKAERFNEEYDEDQAGRIEPYIISEKTANLFFFMFWGRQDVYAKRSSKGGYYPQCENRWKDICPLQSHTKQLCEDCPNKKWQPLTLQIIENHLLGKRTDGADAIGVYPLLKKNTCRFLVFDFDNHEKDAEKNDYANRDEIWKDEVNALRKMCSNNGIDCLVERSRSGRGAHVWIFFKEAVPAYLARSFGGLLLEKGSQSVNLRSFRFYDRMYPSQDHSDNLGNLIALPLQGQAVLRGNTVFVDENWNAFHDQWNALLSTKRLSRQEIEEHVRDWTYEIDGALTYSGLLNTQNRIMPWRRNDSFHKEDVIGRLHIVLADGIYVDALNLSPRIQNQIRCMATIDNPQYYKNRNAGRSNYYLSSMIYLGKDVNGYIQIPRGLFAKLEDNCMKVGILYDVHDERSLGLPIKVRFQGELRKEQKEAAERLLQYDNGILDAATAFGKTVLSSYLIAERKTSTLIILDKNSLVQQWIDELNKFLIIDEKPPKYKTKTGIEKTRSSAIGTLQAGKDKTTGIIDIAMVGSAQSESFLNNSDRYGMVIMDECHHAASPQAQHILQTVKAKYVYGLSATPIRSDNLEKINYMLLGPIRHKYSIQEKMRTGSISYYIHPRFTGTVNLSREDFDIHDAYELISEDEIRNQMIINDVKDAIAKKRTPVVLTRLKKHAKYLYDALQNQVENVYLLYGDNSQKEDREIRQNLLNVKEEESLVLIATGQKIGEGFDFPRLDTMMLASPVKFNGRLIQYIGRLDRQNPGKKDVIIYDYVDHHIRFFDNQYKSRLKTYKSIGYQILPELSGDKQKTHSIFDGQDYTETFERDIVEARKEIIISSPDLLPSKVERLIELIRRKQETGIDVTVICRDPDLNMLVDSNYEEEMILEMKKAGIVVKKSGDENECFAVIDKNIVWHGGMNLLGKTDVWDNLMRIENKEVAYELLEMTHKVLQNDLCSSRS